MPRFEKGSEEAKAYMKSIREGRKLTKNYEKNKGNEDLIMTNTAEIALPKTLLHIDGKGEQKIIKTVTKAGTITRRDKKPVIKLEPITENELKITNQGKTKAGRSRGLLKEIHSNTKNAQEKEPEIKKPEMKINKKDALNKIRTHQIKIITDSGLFSTRFMDSLNNKDDDEINEIFDVSMADSMKKNRDFIVYNKNTRPQIQKKKKKLLD